ncbi:hypothetical protein JCM8547_007581 [Rhodosporidiobolus lusitaniae]
MEVPRETRWSVTRFDSPPGETVCLSSPHSAHKLFVSSSLLAETKTRTQTRTQTTKLLPSSRQCRPKRPRPPAPSTTRTLEISSFSFATYRAFLASSQGVAPTFAPLTSSSRIPPHPSSPVLSHADARKARLSDHKTYHSSFPSLPLPVSPKSLYRLAHFLEIPSLQKVALEGLKQELSPKNVVFELFGKGREEGRMAEEYEEVERVEREFARERLEEVKKGRGLREVREELEKSEAEGREKKVGWALGLLEA